MKLTDEVNEIVNQVFLELPDSAKEKLKDAYGLLVRIIAAQLSQKVEDLLDKKIKEVEKKEANSENKIIYMAIANYVEGLSNPEYEHYDLSYVGNVIKTFYISKVELSELINKNTTEFGTDFDAIAEGLINLLNKNYGS